MKKVFRNNRLIAIALITMFSLTSVSAQQQTGIKSTAPIELKYLGVVKDHVLFELSYFGDKVEDEIRVVIMDVYGNTLFSENIRGTEFSKRFLLKKDEIIEGPLRFAVTSKKTKETKVFEINRNISYVEEVVINTKH